MLGIVGNVVIGLLRSVVGVFRAGLDTFVQSASGGSVGIRVGANFTIQSVADGGTRMVLDSNSNLSIAGNSFQIGSTANGGTTNLRKFVFKKTGIADNTATAVLTVTVPNGNHAGAIRLTFLSSNGGADAFESSRVAMGMVVLARTTGVAVVASAVALTNAGIATVAGGATHTLAYDLSAISGAVGATNTFDVRVTIDDSGNLGASQVTVLAEVLNAESSGVTVAAA